MTTRLTLLHKPVPASSLKAVDRIRPCPGIQDLQGRHYTIYDDQLFLLAFPITLICLIELTSPNLDPMLLGRGDRPSHDDRITSVSTTGNVGDVDHRHQQLIRGPATPMAERFATIYVDFYPGQR
jgi:hypothetical protein